MTTHAVEVVGLKKHFGDVHAVNGIDFTIEKGECFGLLGPNGAGKSTTIKMMTCLVPIDSGTVTIAGQSLKKYPTRIRGLIGYVPQMLSADGTLTGYENLLIFSKLYGLSRTERSRRIEEVLHLIGLEDAAHRQARTYSGGMIRRLEIGQAVLHRPQVLFLDEPTVGLDPVARNSVWEHINGLRQEFNMTILLTTHYMDEAEFLCSRIAIMSRGRLAAMGASAQLKEQIGHPDATMDEVFAYFAGQFEEEEGGMRNVARSRRTARRLG